MKIQFLMPYSSPDFSFAQGDVIDSDTRQPDQIQRWLARGVVQAVDAEPVNPKRTATTTTAKKKAVIE